MTLALHERGMFTWSEAPSARLSGRMIIERFLSELALRRRSITIFLVLAVFFLPLHFHAATAAANINHECACHHGTRAQTGVVPVLVQWAVPLQFVLYQSLQSQLVSQVVVSFLSIRAPPVS